MGYANPLQRISYIYAGIDFGAGDKAASFKGPKGMTGKLKDIVLANVTETFTNTTLEGHVLIGKTAAASEYADAKLGVTAATDTYVASQQAANPMAITNLPADTQIEVTFKAPTGGTPAGISDVEIIVEWY